TNSTAKSAASLASRLPDGLRRGSFWPDAAVHLHESPLKALNSRAVPDIAIERPGSHLKQPWVNCVVRQTTMDPVDYSEAKELLAKYSQRFAPTFSAPHRDLVAEMTTKVEDLDQVSGEIVDLVSRLDKLNHPSEPIPDGEGYDIITIG